MFAALGDPKTAPFVNSKVKKFIALAPIVYMTHITSKFFVRLAKDNLLIDFAKDFGIDEWLPGACSTSSAQSEFESAVCRIEPIFCDWMISIADFNPKYDNEKRMPIFVEHSPSGTSLRTLIHYKQLILEKNKAAPKFLKYDFGDRENEKIYGQKTPPEYDLTNINIPVRGFVGLDDELGDPTDNAFLSAIMQQMGKNYKQYTYNNCGHMTFMWALNATPIFNDILNEIASP